MNLNGGRIIDLNALAQFSALVVAVFNAHADPLALLNSTKTFSPLFTLISKPFYPSFFLSASFCFFLLAFSLYSLVLEL